MINTPKNEKNIMKEINRLKEELENNLRKEDLLSRKNLELSQQLDRIINIYLREYCNY
ncbi:Spo0E like sporulation regulatory protein [Anaerovirgula multivorans]|uniref:Spo0E like sporulation regulatory protein n=1 Tax=Anaerovirgula multivorans TaxID=312168 RepID=A0A239BM38_9FIRM|nr:aspartyl-phosphate phosphatase Spo0E family protein [Anaerovirgula multivorans]SNS09247.1 Spo0E like sporulation regulatory protein [Anaerovirgula multivorans]